MNNLLTFLSFKNLYDFLLWEKWYILKNVSASFVYTMKVKGAQSAKKKDIKGNVKIYTTWNFLSLLCSTEERK